MRTIFFVMLTILSFGATAQNGSKKSDSTFNKVKALEGVNVQGKRPLIVQKIDRTILNVEASITNVGTSALEVLEQAPGVIVDKEGNISLKGKSGVVVMVDGRPTHLGGTDLANMLRNMSSNQLDQIEIMTNPPARYDASGNSGIINIKTKKTNTIGYNGSANLAYSQGLHAKTNEGFNLNYRNEKLNLFTNLSHNYNMRNGTLTIQRNLRNSTTYGLEKYFDQRGEKINKDNSFNARMGLDYFLNKKTTVGVMVNGTASPSEMQNENITHISTAAKDLESITKATVSNSSDWKSFSTNLNFRRQLNAKGKEITSDLDFITYGSGNRQRMINSLFDASGALLSKTDTLIGYLPQNIKIYSGRIDYSYPIKKDSRFDAGIKSSIVRTDNNALYDSIVNGRIVHDLNRSNHFIYEENVNAAYANLNTPLSKKISAQLGLRLENTNANGRQLTTGQTFDRHYTQLFPTAFLQYKVDVKNTVGVNYGRRVRRPNYESLNPFIKFIDRYTYSQGNPNLKPQLSNNFELSYNYKNQVTATLNYTSTKDVIDKVFQQRGQEVYLTTSNIASLKQVGVSVIASHTINKWWNSNISVNGFHNFFRGVGNDPSLTASKMSYIFNASQQFKITKKLSGELNGRMRSGWQEGGIQAKSVGFMGAGLSQQIMKNKATVRLAVRDMFHSQKFSAVSRYGNVDAAFQEINDTRVVTLGFSYRFSKGKKITPAKRTAGSANEEQERVGN